MKAFLAACAILWCVSAPAMAQPCQPTGDNMRPCAAGTGGTAVATLPGPKKGRLSRLSDPVVRQMAPRRAKPAPAPRTSLQASGLGLAGAAVGPMQCVLDGLRAAGYPVRFARGLGAGSVPGSLHPAGLAMDVNQVARGVTTPRMPSSEIAIASSCGVISGAQWANNDSGHFQLGGWSGTGRRGHSHSIHRHHRRR